MAWIPDWSLSLFQGRAPVQQAVRCHAIVLRDEGTSAGLRFSAWRRSWSPRAPLFATPDVRRWVSLTPGQLARCPRRLFPDCGDLPGDRRIRIREYVNVPAIVLGRLHPVGGGAEAGMKHRRTGCAVQGRKARRVLAEPESRRILWMYTSRHVYRMLVNGGGWTPNRYEAWLSTTLLDALVDSRALT